MFSKIALASTALNKGSAISPPSDFSNYIVNPKLYVPTTQRKVYLIYVTKTLNICYFVMTLINNDAAKTQTQTINRVEHSDSWNVELVKSLHSSLEKPVRLVSTTSGIDRVGFI